MDDRELLAQQRRERKLERQQAKHRRRAIIYYLRFGAVLLLLIPLIFLSIWITVPPSDETTSPVSGRVVEVGSSSGKKNRSFYIRLDNGFKYTIPRSIAKQYADSLQGLRDKVDGQYVELRIYDRALAYSHVVSVNLNGEEFIGYHAFADTYRENRTWSIVLSVVLVLGIELYLLCTYTRPKRYRKKS